VGPPGRPSIRTRRAGPGRARYPPMTAPGFRCEISPRWFRVGGRWLTGDWDAYLRSGAARCAPSRCTPRSSAPASGRSRGRSAPGVRFGVRWVGRQLHVQVVPPRRAAPVRAAEESWCRGRCHRARCGRECGLADWRRSGPRRHRYRLGAVRQQLGDGGIRAARSVAVTDLLRALSPAGPALGQDAAIEWDCTRSARRQGAPGWRSRPACPEYRYPEDGRRSLWNGPGTATRGSGAAQAPVIDAHSWTTGGSLILSGSYAAPAALRGGARPEVIHRRHALPVERRRRALHHHHRATAMPSFGPAAAAATTGAAARRAAWPAGQATATTRW